MTFDDAHVLTAGPPATHTDCCEQMVPGVIIMTTYKLVVIPHPPSQSGINSTCTGVMVDTSADERYLPFGHLPKEYVQVRRFDHGEWPKRAALLYLLPR